MDYLRSFDPVAIAREHVPIVDALDSNLPELAASLLDSHSSHPVTFLAQETTHSAMAACGQSRSGLGLAAAKPVAKPPATRE